MRRIKWILTFSLVVGLAAAVNAQPGVDTDEISATDPGVETLSRGPLHEAFAEPVLDRPVPTFIVPKEPPAAIDEIPPAEQLDERAVWIPGYWAWDDERQDFLWVSGIYRVPPPGRQWIPGYWRAAEGGSQWVPGYWSTAETDEVAYLPEPPASLDTGPTTPAPAADYLWNPGTWLWSGSRYQWQAGTWMAARPGWIWVPSYYVWTPGGYVASGGYWDFVLGQRGVVYAPAYFSQPVYTQPGYVYRPGWSLNVSMLLGNLFLRPNYSHYYFGDYFAPNYAKYGFQPWYSAAGRSRVYQDPLFRYYAWSNRGDWARQIQHRYQTLAANPALRPPRSIQSITAQRPVQRGPSEAALLSRVSRAAFAERQAVRPPANIQAVHDLRRIRQEHEARIATTLPKVSTEPRPARMPSIRSPIRGEAVKTTAAAPPRVRPPAINRTSLYPPAQPTNPGAETQRPTMPRATGQPSESRQPTNPRVAVPSDRRPIKRPREGVPLDRITNGRTEKSTSPINRPNIEPRQPPKQPLIPRQPAAPNPSPSAPGRPFVPGKQSVAPRQPAQPPLPPTRPALPPGQVTPRERTIVPPSSKPAAKPATKPAPKAAVKAESK